MQDRLDLNRLTEFNHALIYAFEAEGSAKAEQGSEKLCDMFYPLMQQFSDTFNAYLFAQETTLPMIQHQGLHAISHTQWLELIKQIHQRIGHSLLLNLNATAGTYVSTFVYRWHPGGALEDEITAFLAGIFSPMPSLTEFCAVLEATYKRPQIDFENIINLIQKIHNDDAIQLTPSQQNMASTRLSSNAERVGSRMLTKLQVAYHQGRLSEEEKQQLNKIVKVSTLPEAIPAAMSAFIERFMTSITTLDIKNVDEISEFITTTFYEFVDVHPFPNANGRTATCFINILLRSMGLPSILLRHPGENENPSSLYSRAIARIDESRDLLNQLINMRIKDAITAPYACENLKLVILHRIALSTLCQQINTAFPSFDIDSYWSQVTDLLPRDILELKDENLRDLNAVQWLINKFTTLKTLLERKETKKPITYSQTTLPASQQNLILQKLQDISGIPDGWKAYKRGAVFILEHKNQAKVIEIAAILNQSKACKASTAVRADNKEVHVVQVVDITNALLVLPTNTSSVTHTQMVLK